MLEAVATAWRDPAKRAQMMENGERLLERLRQAAALPGRLGASGELITEEPIGRAVTGLLASHDPEFGGFGPAPKFPPSRQLTLLLQRAAAGRADEALPVVRRTLRSMADGGLADQLGGGFHRYSTDREWLVPHFEKMLYDNALLVPVYLLAGQVTGSEAYFQDARRALDWMAEMRAPEGGFHAALDADSEGEEGRFYVWRLDEVKALLGEETSRFAAAYDLRPEGNWEGKTILRRVASDEELAGRLGGTPEETAARACGVARPAARGARPAHRARPRRQGAAGVERLAISAFAQASRVLGEERYLALAQEAGRFVLDRLRVEGRYFAVWGGGRAKVPAMLDDHAFWLAGLLDLYESDFDERWLLAADEVADLLDARFAAPGGGCYTTADDHEKLPVRTRTGYDGALPSGNAVAADALLRLHALTGDARRRSAARGILAAFWPQARKSPAGFATLLSAGMRYLAEPRQIVVVGDRSHQETRAALQRLWRIPGGLVLLADAETAGSRLPALQSAAALARRKAPSPSCRAAEASAPGRSRTSTPPASICANEAVLTPGRRPPRARWSRTARRPRPRRGKGCLNSRS